MNLPTLSVVHNRRRLSNKSGKYPVHIRITIDRASKYHPIDLPEKITKEQWSGMDDYWVKNTHPFYFETNTKIREQKLVIQNLIKRYYLAGKKMSFSVIFSHLNQADLGSCFNIFFANYIKNPNDKLEPDTFKKYKACLDHVNSYNKEITFQELTPELIEEFYHYCRDKKNLKGSTIDSYFNASLEANPTLVARIGLFAHL
jgi:hypothetical protein